MGSCQRQTKLLDGIESAKTLIVCEGVRGCVEAAGWKARAIVLTGSFSRGEATLKRDGNGWRALGDATFVLVHPRPASINTARIEAEIERRLASHAIRCKTVVVASTATALKTMKPHIYAYELRERGIVVWGDRTVLDLMPRFTAAEIPIEDGWWFLCNRMIEQLKTAAEQYDCSAKERIQYRIAKLYLAMAACYLLAIGEYQPSYRDRARHLNELAFSPSPPPSPICLRRFARFVSECTDLKLRGHAADDRTRFPQWSDAVSDAEELWRWILGRILNVNPRSRSELLRLMRERQPVLARSKGWMRAALKYPALFGTSCGHWMRLTRLGSPRYLVYGAASELFFRGAMQGDKSNELAAIANDLPLNRSGTSGQLTWNGLASLIADNFHMFVESTRT